MKADLVFQSRLSADELSELSNLWADALEGMGETDFLLGMKWWTKVGGLFPKPSQIVEAVGEAHAEAHRAKIAAQSQRPALPIGIRTPEEIAHFQAKCRELRALVARNGSPVQPFKQRCASESATQ